MTGVHLLNNLVREAKERTQRQIPLRMGKSWRRNTGSARRFRFAAGASEFSFGTRYLFPFLAFSLPRDCDLPPLRERLCRSYEKCGYQVALPTKYTCVLRRRASRNLTLRKMLWITETLHESSRILSRICKSRSESTNSVTLDGCGSWLSEGKKRRVGNPWIPYCC